MNERILIIEDEAPMRRALADLLASEGYRALAAADGVSGLQRALAEKPDLILLDVMMPKLDGFALCAELRRMANPVPVVMLTAKGQIEDRVSGLDVGADDYLVKPFSTDELLARVRALLRRVERISRGPLKLKLGEVEIDLARQTAVSGKKPIPLTAKEFAMLRLMAEAAGEPVTREKFLDVVWGYTAFPTTRTVDNHIASLRAKLERNPDEPRWVKTVHGVGYKLELSNNFTKT
jgi:DNA-binding response OmpR family regulator